MISPTRGKRLRPFLHHRPDVTTGVLRILVRAIRTTRIRTHGDRQGLLRLELAALQLGRAAVPNLRGPPPPLP